MWKISGLIFTILFINFVCARNDGQARTPPMGWLSWTSFQCETDCKTYPKACINEELYKEQADRLAKDGFKELGYEYVNIDDCWSEMQRDSHNRLVADKKRFPSGMKALADYVHSKGLKLGIYGDVGPTTCAHYPGQNGKNGSNYFALDAKTFAEWGVDSFKMDGCNEDSHHFDDLFPKMGKALNESGRHMLFICEWPLYQHGAKIKINWDAVVKTCHVFRNYRDIAETWNSIESVINFYGDNNALLMKYNAPGQFFDPDMMVIGDYGLSYDQAKTHMAMWAMWSAPLYMSNDLRNLGKDFKDLLQNKAVIAVNQDRHGLMAKRVYKQNFKRSAQQVWVKQVEPKVKDQWSYAVVYMETDPWGMKYLMSHKVSDLIPNTKNSTQYVVHDLFRDEGKEILGKLKPSQNLELLVHVAGGCRMVKLVPE